VVDEGHVADDAAEEPVTGLRGSFWRTTFSSLKVPNYRLYFAGQSISLAGTWMQMTAQSWLVLVLTHSSTDLGLVVALQTLPILLFAAYGGVVADRTDKRKLMVVLQAIMGVQALVLGLLTVFGTVRFWEICVLAVVLGLNNAFENSARQAFVREMVGKDELRNAITLNSVTVNAARAVGPAIGGVLIATVGVGVCFLVNAASFVAVVTSLLVMNTAALRPSPPAPRARGQLREGLQHAVRTADIAIPLAMMSLVGMLAYEFQVSLPVLARQTFHGNAVAYGFMTASMGVGAVIGGLFTAARGRTGLRPMIIASTGFGIAILACAYSPVIGLAYAALLFVGWASVSFIAIGNSTIQLAADPSIRGRVIALWQVAFQGTTPIGGPLIGVIIAISDPRTGLAVGGLSCLVAALGGYLLARRYRLRALGRAEPAAAGPDTGLELPADAATPTR
jgi:MFS family permease